MVGCLEPLPSPCLNQPSLKEERRHIQGLLLVFLCGIDAGKTGKLIVKGQGDRTQIKPQSASACPFSQVAKDYTSEEDKTSDTQPAHRQASVRRTVSNKSVPL